MPFEIAYYEDSPHIIRNGPLTIRKFQTTPPETIILGCIFNSYPIEIEIEQNEAKIRMSSLLPEGWRIVESLAANSTNGFCEPRDSDSYVAIPIYGETASREGCHFLEADYSLCTLLHEIGHAWQEKNKTIEEQRVTSYVRHELARKLDVRSGVLPNPVENKLLIEYVYQYERGAWLFALRTLRQLRSIGFTLEPNLNAKDIVGKVRRSLDTYKQDLINEKGVTFNSYEREQIQSV